MEKEKARAIVENEFHGSKKSVIDTIINLLVKYGAEKQEGIYFLTHIGIYETATKNKLQDAVREFLYSEQGKLIPGKSVQNYKEYILSEIKKLNDKFSRCKALKPEWWTGNLGGKPSDKIILSELQFITFQLLKGEIK